ncbi:hypothetical protein DFP72DRAFT_1068852 [Ephemerocybe angulata]|uniref:Uncharacterized protein n=1 Tax=Ephemerocybe angulata TaxID=980116 RepID=A0A8H6HW46_9AGAR|nr:hypothetical protein DFP72DRAFT_1068852 [Tulosesus angulatus]
MILRAKDVSVIPIQFALPNTATGRDDTVRPDHLTWTTILQPRVHALIDALPPYTLSINHSYKHEMFELTDWLLPTYVRVRNLPKEEETTFWSMFRAVLVIWEDTPFMSTSGAHQKTGYAKDLGE